MIAAIYGHSLELHQKRSVLWQLVRQQLILRYRRTVLGYFWTLLNPLLMMAVSSVVFANLFQMDLKTYAVYLFAGTIPWNCFNSIIAQSSTSFVVNEGLIKKIYLPKAIFPLSTSLALLVDNALSFVALSIMIFAIGGKFSFALAFLPISYLLLFFFAFGVALMASVVVVFFRDVQHMIGVFMQAWFYLTPIVYKADALGGKAAWLIKLNPMVPFIALFRAPIYDGTLPPFSVILHSAILAAASILIGVAFFLTQEKKIVFRL